MKSDSGSQSYWLKSGAYSLFTILSQLVFGMGSMLILVRALEKPVFGIWAIYMVTTTFIEVPRAGLLQNGLLKFLSTEPEKEHGRIITASMVINALFTGVVVIVLYFGSGLIADWQKAPILQSLLLVYIGITMVLMPFFNLNYIQQANLDFRGIFWSTFVRFGLFFGYNLYNYIMGNQVELIGLVWVQLVAAIFGSLVSIIFTKRYFKWSKQIDWDWVKQLVNYGKYVFGTNLATMIHKKADVMLLGSLLSKSASAIQDVAVKITYLIEAPALAAASVVFPQSARAGEKGLEGVKLLYEKVVGIIVGILLPVALFVILFPKFVINIIAGPEYFDAVGILRITVTYGLIIPFAIQFGTTLDSIGLPKINFFYTTFGAMLNLLLIYVMVGKFGVIGAAYASLISYSIMLVLQQIFLRKRVGVNFLSIFKYMFEFYWGLPKLIKGILNK